MNFFKEAMTIKEELVSIRRKLHENPELGMEEFETSKFIKRFLKSEGIEFKEYAITGVCGIIKGTKDSNIKGKTIALRADMDGLPLEDKKNCSYSSKVKGKMHGCGHDAHTSILLGAAKILNNKKHLFNGNIKLIFEPAEETIGGSQIMIEEGILENPKVDSIAGLHVEETLECGKVMVKEEYVNAASNPFKIKIIGYGGHGAYPHLTIDPIVIASHLVIALQSIISREINSLNPAVITVGSINGGTAQNIIPEEVEVKGIIRTLNKEDRAFAVKRLEEITKGITETFRGKASIYIEESYPSLYNNKNMVKLLKDISKNVIKSEDFIEQKHSKLGVESFAYFAEKVPGVFYFLGSGNKKKNIIHPAHSNLFDIDEKCLPIGVALQCEIALEYLTRE
ncbi:M20 family metallopeptidase [Clostridium sp.]|uniref:M20 metallopeptidase family protein n=1 Tax=Clostridium sp. TaxID=1506 RepID=UPI002615B830|nr:M20 family metallopeptidase [Clostridium sp.]